VKQIKTNFNKLDMPVNFTAKPWKLANLWLNCLSLNQLATLTSAWPFFRHPIVAHTSSDPLDQ
jgi:hypothetical protein